MTGYAIQSRKQPLYFVQLGYGPDADSVGHWYAATFFSRREPARRVIHRLRHVSPTWIAHWGLRIVKVRLTVEARR